MSTKKGLELLRTKYNKESGWRYGGGNEKRITLEDGSYYYISTSHSRYYEQLRHKWNKEGFNCRNYMPRHRYKCLCDHDIVENCFIYRKVNDKKILIRVIGNCCIKKFDLGGRHCEVCDAQHKNTKDNICNECRDDIKAKEKIKKQFCECGKKKYNPRHLYCVKCYYS